MYHLTQPVNNAFTENPAGQHLGVYQATAEGGRTRKQSACADREVCCPAATTRCKRGGGTWGGSTRQLGVGAEGVAGGSGRLDRCDTRDVPQVVAALLVGNSMRGPCVPVIGKALCHGLRRAMVGPQIDEELPNPTGQVADGASAIPLAVGGGAAIAALGAALIATDPEKRCGSPGLQVE